MRQMLSLPHPYHLPWHSFYSSRPRLPLQTSTPFTSGLSLSPGVSSQKCQNINISGSGPQVIMLRAGDQIFQLPPLRCNSGPSVTLSSKVAQQDCASDAHRVTCWIMYPFSDSLAHCPVPSGVPWIPSKLNYMHFNARFRACFWGSPNSDS